MLVYVKSKELNIRSIKYFNCSQGLNACGGVTISGLPVVEAELYAPLATTIW